MKEFIRQHEARIHGVLSCFDRMLFRGYLPIMSGWSMAQFLKGNSCAARLSTKSDWIAGVVSFRRDRMKHGRRGRVSMRGGAPSTRHRGLMAGSADGKSPSAGVRKFREGRFRSRSDRNRLGISDPRRWSLPCRYLCRRHLWPSTSNCRRLCHR
jgi:hypothetical protein